ncbi:MAG: PilW family protein [Candidatus Methylomirabilales bacterium]
MRRNHRANTTPRTGRHEIPRQFPLGVGGFTLIEIMIALSTFLIVLFAVYSSFESSRATFAAGEQRADIQQNARIAMELMGSDLRLVGYGYPAGLGAITNATATSITFWGDVMNASTTLAADIAAGTTTLPVDNALGIADGDTIYLINGGQWEQATLVTPNGVNTAVVPNTITITAGTANAYPWGSQVGLPRQVTYSWAAGPAPNPGTIFKDDGTGPGLQPLADNIQAFQILYFDANGNPTAVLANIRQMTISFTAQSPPGWWRQQNFTITSDIRVRNLS